MDAVVLARRAYGFAVPNCNWPGGPWLDHLEDCLRSNAAALRPERAADFRSKTPAAPLTSTLHMLDLEQNLAAKLSLLGSFGQNVFTLSLGSFSQNERHLLPWVRFAKKR